MPRYNVKVSRMKTEYGWVEVTADSADEAIGEAEDLILHGSPDIDWGSETPDFVGCDVELVEEMGK